jgi:hypothetical protein
MPETPLHFWNAGPHIVSMHVWQAGADEPASVVHSERQSAAPHSPYVPKHAAHADVRPSFIPTHMPIADAPDVMLLSVQLDTSSPMVALCAVRAVESAVSVQALPAAPPVPVVVPPVPLVVVWVPVEDEVPPVPVVAVVAVPELELHANRRAAGATSALILNIERSMEGPFDTQKNDAEASERALPQS